MINLEKVVKGLEIHTNMRASCKDCPYWDGVGYGCHNLWSDALKVLEAQKSEIERLEHDLAVTEDNINHYVNGKD